MQIGDLIRAYDFPSTDACYMEGRVVEIDEDYKRITVKTTDVVFNDEHKEFGEVLGNDTFTTPMLGYAFSDDMTRYNEDKGLSRHQSRIVLVG